MEHGNGIVCLFVVITIFLCFDLNLRVDDIRLAADITRLALEVLFVLSVDPNAQLAFCEEIQLPSGESQTGVRCDVLKSASSHLLCEVFIIVYIMIMYHKIICDLSRENVQQRLSAVGSPLGGCYEN